MLVTRLVTSYWLPVISRRPANSVKTLVAKISLRDSVILFAKIFRQEFIAIELFQAWLQGKQSLFDRRKLKLNCSANHRSVEH